MKIDNTIRPKDLSKPLDRLFSLAERKVAALDRSWDPAKGTPVFTVKGKYTTRGWTEWTQGFQYGCAILVFDATDNKTLIDGARVHTRAFMAPHVSHVGVHDHGFNNLSTYGNLRRLMREGRIKYNAWEMAFYELAIKVSGAVQAARWSPTHDGLGYIYSFNGPHSLFVDTMRTIRILGVAHQLDHVLMGENDAKINLLHRAAEHALTTAKHIVFHGDSEHTYDVRGRTAHEAIFNRNDGRFRCRSSQQGYSPFSTWTRGLAWAMLGYAEELEFFASLPKAQWKGFDHASLMRTMLATAKETSDHYIDDCAASDGIVYWDDGAPGLAKLEGWRDRPADPYNDHEPVDASASAIAAQGLLRLGKFLGAKGKRYTQAGLTIARVLLDEPYLSTDRKHEGLLLHSVYHRPNNWDYIPPARRVPCGESSMWGDYHLLELATHLRRLAVGPYLTFFDG